jgi:murein DD-endopeptidase MepM/ murein hydrolase activator NlpD
LSAARQMDETCMNVEKAESGLPPGRRKPRRTNVPDASGAGGRKLRTRRLNRNALYITIGVAVAAIAILAVTMANANRPSLYAVTADGELIGYTDDPSIIDQIVWRLSEEESFRVGAEAIPSCQVDCQKVKWEKGLEVTDPDRLGETLKERIGFVAKGYVVCVNGEDVVALCSEDAARGALDDLRKNYISSIVDAGHATVEEVLIKERIDIVEQEVPTDLFRSKDEAVAILTRGTDKMLSYVVQRGDSLWAIAQANNMTVEELRRANPNIQGDLIKPGDNLNLIVPDPYVTLYSRELVTYTVSIPFSTEVTYDSSMWPWQETVIQAGKSGQKEIVEEIQRENGQEVGRRRLSEKILSYPETRKVVKGNKQVPEMGSGELAWPVQGTITSNFGPRWGTYHRGVDIGAPAGTPVIAADSGMVVFAGWNGGYGNLVKVAHGSDMQTWYAHLSEIKVSTGQEVKKGDVIGYVGSTGRSTGPHLHFEVHVEGVAKDPLSFYK